MAMQRGSLRLVLKGRGGFSIGELLIVLVLISMIAAFSVPSFNKFKRSHDLRNATLKFQSDLRLSQRVAAARRIQRVITIDDRLYHVLDDLDSDGVQDDGERLETYQLPGSVSFASVTLTPPDSIVFVPAGTLAAPGHGGTLALVTGKGQRKWLRLWSTGTVEIIDGEEVQS